jgi:hypothetical protein
VAGTILIRNDDDAAVDRFGVLGITGVAIDHAASASEFENRPVLTGTEPTVADHRNKFVVAQEPIAVGGFGRAMVFGVTPVVVNVLDADHVRADVKNTDATSLESGITGAAHILWKETGTGDKWALVAIGVPDSPAGVFPVKVTHDGGTAGSAVATCSFTYIVKDLAGVELDTALTPAQARLPNCEYAEPAADSYGLACYSAAGALVLLQAYQEIPLTDTCE